jgi:hypothetical protein
MGNQVFWSSAISFLPNLWPIYSLFGPVIQSVIVILEENKMYLYFWEQLWFVIGATLFIYCNIPYLFTDVLPPLQILSRFGFSRHSV